MIFWEINFKETTLFIKLSIDKRNERTWYAPIQGSEHLSSCLEIVISVRYRHYLVNEGPSSTVAQKGQHKNRKRKNRPKHQQIKKHNEK